MRMLSQSLRSLGICLGSAFPWALALALLTPFAARFFYHLDPLNDTLSQLVELGLAAGALSLVIMFLSSVGLVSAVVLLRAFTRARIPADVIGAIARAAPPVSLFTLGSILWLNVRILRYRYATVSLVVDVAVLLLSISLLWALARRLQPSSARAASAACSPWRIGSSVALVALGSVAALQASAPPAIVAKGLPAPHRGHLRTAVVGNGKTPPSKKRWNLVILSVDTLRPDHLGCHGYERPVSPNIDELAKHGVVFARAYSQAPWTLPSHMTMITGQYPSTHGAVISPTFVPGADPLPQEKTTLAEVLARHGYATAAFTSSPLLGKPYGFDQGFQVIDYHARGLGISGRWEAARTWLTTVKDHPYFLFLHCYDVHNYNPPKAEEKRFVREYHGPLLSLPQSQSLRTKLVSDGFFQLSKLDIRYLTDLYDASIAHVDKLVGEMLAYLEQTGDSANTVLVLLSDHGEEFFEHGGTGHGFTLFEEQLRVALIMKVPGAPDALTIRNRVRLVDLMPTLLELLDIPPPQELQGKSFAPMVWGEHTEADRPVFAEASHLGNSAALITGALKFIRQSYFPAELFSPRLLLYNLRQIVAREPDQIFNLGRDPGESNPIDEPRVASRLAKQLEAFRRTLRDSDGEPFQGGLRPLSEEVTSELRALGYVQ